MSVSADFSVETLQARGSNKIYSKSWKAEIRNLGYSTQQDHYLQ